MNIAQRKRQAKILRIARKLHRTTGALLFIFFFILACTGLLLGWKKHTGGVILPKSYAGVSTEMKNWLPVDVLHQKALTVTRERISPDMSPELERIDFRADKGMVKFVFVEDYWGVQLDCTTGELLHIERRRSDFIENIHDGSILDYLIDTDGEQFKLVYTTIMGSALLLFAISGFWLWYGPKQFKVKKLKSEKVGHNS
jgi:uncharacterized iron-regulated membrane protein